MTTTTDEQILDLLQRLCASGRARELRVSARITLGEAARRIGVDKGHLSRWERGDRAPTTSHISAYVDFLDGLAMSDVARRIGTEGLN